jgi:2-keto-4-pentenoate hydratase
MSGGEVPGMGSSLYRSATVGRAAATLVASRLSGRQLGDLPEEIRPSSALTGYLVQRSGHAILEEAGFGRQGGWKIGCTTTVMQAYLGIGSPVAGAMFRSNMWHAKHRFKIEPPRALGVECEIAARVGRDLLGGEGDYSPAEIGSAIASVMAAIEVVEDRYLDYRALDVPTLIADDFFHYGCVLGAEIEPIDPGALSNVSATMAINQMEVGHGLGTDILGNPLLALAWLANHCVFYGTPLRAGDIVLLGSLVQTRWVAPGDTVEVHNDLLGDVSASFA